MKAPGVTLLTAMLVIAMLSSALLLGCGVFDCPIANTAGACVSIADVPAGVNAVRVKMPNLDEFSAQQKDSSTWAFCIDESQAQRTNFTSVFAARIIMLTGEVFITFEEGPISTTYVNERQFPVYKNRTLETTYRQWTSLEQWARLASVSGRSSDTSREASREASRDTSGDLAASETAIPWQAHVEKTQETTP